ncbi:hypothetical protein [Archangium lipolyticum]|uniref:hypothetical protein n=1 Tax=Archangium lipolyticum TaxID=2970465 RepID=UPI00214A7D16|nr:hypothetical protein [Archangium lipolyticum]
MMRGSGDRTRGGWSRVGWRGAWVLVWAVLLGACRDPDAVSGTALYVTTEFTPTLLLTQVRVWGEVEGGPSFGPHLLPEQPERLLQSGETLRILLGDAPNGARTTVYIEGLNDSGTVARGENSTHIRDGYEVKVAIRLEAKNPDGGNGTFCIECNGCCIEGICTRPTFQTCGAGGISCVACDEARANACDARGVCVCGTQPSCTGVNVDRCENGQCKCGSSGPCGAGQACVNGTCQCTPDSCDGCCSGNTCEPGNTKDKCGKGGEACSKCKSCNADRTCG